MIAVDVESTKAIAHIYIDYRKETFLTEDFALELCHAKRNDPCRYWAQRLRGTKTVRSMVT